MTKSFFVLAAFSAMTAMLAQNTSVNLNRINDADLLNQYIQAKGTRIILFDTSNIKQFWTDKTVINKADHFDVLMRKSPSNGFESNLLRIQLANVDESYDCKIEVITSNSNFNFFVLDNKKRIVSSSAPENNFVSYDIASSLVHLEDLTNTSFYLQFNSDSETLISIKTIVLSFTKNKSSHFLSSPGVLRITSNNVVAGSTQITETSPESFSITGKQSKIFSNKKIFATNNTFSSSVTIKNTGDQSTRVYLGYAVYSKDNIKLDGSNYPYRKNQKIIHVVSVSEDRQSIIVDSYCDWSKNCYLALNAKDDLSDIPNTLLGGRVVEMRQLENNQAEISLEKSINAELMEGTNLRIHGKSGTYLYTNFETMQPGEEKTFTSSIKKDEAFFEYSQKAFSKGVYYVIPLIFSYSIDSQRDNTILITDFMVSY